MERIFPPYIEQRRGAFLFFHQLFRESDEKQYFAVKLEEVIAQEAFIKSHESEEKMKAELRRSEVMTHIVSKLESEDSFADIVENILEFGLWIFRYQCSEHASD